MAYEYANVLPTETTRDGAGPINQDRVVGLNR